MCQEYEDATQSKSSFGNEQKNQENVTIPPIERSFTSSKLIEKEENKLASANETANKVMFRIKSKHKKKKSLFKPIENQVDIED